MNEFYDPESVAPWYVAIRATENFRAKHGRYPGCTEKQVSDDFEELKSLCNEIMN